MNKLQTVARDLNENTMDQGLLSFSDGAKSMLEVRDVTQDVAWRITNNTIKDRIIYFCPKKLIGGLSLEEFTGGDYEGQELPDGHEFSVGTFEESAGKELTIESLNPEQHPTVLATGWNNQPTQFKDLSCLSYSIEGVPENTNYGNSLTHYRLSHMEEPKRSTPMRLNKFMSSKDASTEILKIDLLKNYPKAIVSQYDVLAIKVNKGTYLDITFGLGARLSTEEFFYRQVTGSVKVLNRHFPDESSCGN